MSRGKRPLVAIADAKRHTVARGLALIDLVAPAPLPYDFAFHDDGGTTTLVRVRRVKYAMFRVEEISRTCAWQISELRESPVMGTLAKELWVRGPDRHWHRYEILPDSIREVPENPDFPLPPDSKKQDESTKTEKTRTEKMPE